MGTTYMDFSTGVFHVDGDAPLTQAQVDSVWKHLPTTGASWIERGNLFVQQFDGAKAFNLGPVARGVKGTSDKTRFTGHSKRRHATMKKSPAQLQREIDHALKKPSGRQHARVAKSPGRQHAQAAKKANDAIYDLIHNKYFQSIPNDELFGIVKRAGFRFDPEDEEFILVGRDGKATWQLHDEAGREVNHMLVLQWHKLDRTGKYEVVAYVS